LTTSNTASTWLAPPPPAAERPLRLEPDGTLMRDEDTESWGTGVAAAVAAESADRPRGSVA
jgi:hypothetical protein